MSGPIQNTHPTTPPPPRIEPSRGEPSRAQGAGQVQPQGGNVTIPSATPGYEQQYEVRQGDTLSAISKTVYGNANQYNKIFEANRPMLSSPDKIYPGQTLRIPKA